MVPRSTCPAGAGATWTVATFGLRPSIWEFTWAGEAPPEGLRRSGLLRPGLAERPLGWASGVQGADLTVIDGELVTTQRWTHASGPAKFIVRVGR